MTDREAAEVLAASSWDTMQADAEGHRAALHEAGEALAAFLCADLVARVRPGLVADAGALCAEVRRMRAERRIGR